MENSSQVDVVAHFSALPGKEDDLRQVLESLVAPTRLEDGCLRYDLFHDVEDPSKFTFIEEWTSAEALAKHGRSPHIVAGRLKFPGLVGDTRWVQKLRQIA
jgi:quinol monooxygenase YgiN